MEVTGIFRESGKESEALLEDYFVASVNPFYLGILLKPSRGIWEYLKNNDSVIIRLGKSGPHFEMNLKYRIEVGENTIFFLNPTEEENFRKSFMES